MSCSDVWRSTPRKLRLTSFCEPARADGVPATGDLTFSLLLWRWFAKITFLSQPSVPGDQLTGPLADDGVFSNSFPGRLWQKTVERPPNTYYIRALTLRHVDFPMNQRTHSVDGRRPLWADSSTGRVVGFHGPCWCGSANSLQHLTALAFLGSSPPCSCLWKWRNKL